MEAATCIQAVSDGGENWQSCKAIPCALDDQIKGCVEHGSNPGLSTVLSAEEESALESITCYTCIYMAEHEFPLLKKMGMAFAWTIDL